MSTATPDSDDSNDEQTKMKRQVAEILAEKACDNVRDSIERFICQQFTQNRADADLIVSRTDGRSVFRDDFELQVYHTPFPRTALEGKAVSIIRYKVNREGCETRTTNGWKKRLVVIEDVEQFTEDLLSVDGIVSLKNTLEL